MYYAKITDKTGKIISTCCPPNFNIKRSIVYAEKMYEWKTENGKSNIDTITLIDSETKEEKVFKNKV